MIFTFNKGNMDRVDISNKGDVSKYNVNLGNGKDEIELPEELVHIEVFDYNDRYSYFDMNPRVLGGGYVWRRRAVVVKGETVLAEDIEIGGPSSFSPVWKSEAVIQKSDNGTDMLVMNIPDESEPLVIGEISYDNEIGKYICEGFRF